MIPLVSGLQFACALLAGLFFLRFWKQTRDSFFLLFAIAFWILGVQWVGLAFEPAENETRRAFYYSARLLAFLLILAAIAIKNRSRS